MSQLQVETTPIPGLLVLHLPVHYNDDGWFKENWHRDKMGALGLPDFEPVQHNVTHVAGRGVTRGFHAEPWDRLVTVMQGRAFGAWVDLRQGAGFGRTFSCDFDRAVAVFVPRGVGNAHQVLDDDTTLSYLLEHHWTPEGGAGGTGVNLFDPALQISWPIGPERADVSQRDKGAPRLVDAAAMGSRRTLVVGTETALGRALAAAFPAADGVTTAAVSLEADRPLDLSAYDVIVNAHGDVGAGEAHRGPAQEDWGRAAARAHRLADIARRHHLRYVHVSADCVFERAATQHREDARLDVGHPRARALAAGEIVAVTVPRHLIVRTGWVVGDEGGALGDAVTAARKGVPARTASGHLGRLTYASRLAAGITHLLDVGAPAGTYNLTGDGPVVGGTDVVRRVFDILGADAGLVTEVPAAQGEATDAVLNLERIKATGFRPGNSWLDLIDHLPHPTRGSAPVAASVAGPTTAERGPYRVLFVCTANICRSAYADVVARATAPEGVEFGSAGIRALVGQGIDPPMAAEVGQCADASGHVARQLTRQLMAESDLVVAMSAEHRRFILDEWPALGRKTYVIGHVARELRGLPDGVGLDGVVDHLWRHRTTQSGDEVADPYGRGAEAAATAAREIDGYLEIIVGRLGSLSG